MKYLLLMLLSFPLWADTVEVTFTSPTEREDGTLLPIAEIQDYRVYLNGVENMTVPKTETLFEMVLTPGLYDINMTTLDLDGRESLLSNTVSVQAKSPPGNPTNLLIKILRK